MRPRRHYLAVLSLTLSGALTVAQPAAPVVRSRFTAAAQTPEEKGLAVAEEAQRRWSGFGDSSVNIRMFLRTREGDERVRELRSQTLEGKEDGDRVLVVFGSPPDVKGTALLVFSHENGADDQWLFLPALKRVRRIAPSNQSGPFMGSEFAYEDLASEEVQKFTYRWLRDESCPGVEYPSLTCFVVERRPVSRESTGYARQNVWIDREEYRTLRIEYLDRRDAPLKTLTLTRFERHQGRFWRPGEMLMTNQQTGKSTRLVWSEFRFGTGLTESDFNPQNLTRGR